MLKRKVIVLIFAIWAALLLGSRAYADTLTVTSAADDTDPGTLRNIIRAANPGDTIIFAPSLAGSTIFLSASRQSLIIDKTLSINGSNFITVSATRRPFSVFKVTNGTFSVSRLTITGSGYSPDVIAGGIYCNQGTGLAVTDCAIIDNEAFQAGGILAQGPLTLVRTTISNNHAFSTSTGAGGVSVIGNGNTPLTITDCTIANNQGANGGLFISNGAFGTIRGTAIDNNTTNDGVGGAANIHSSDIVFQDCFIRSNTGFTALSASDRVSSADSHHLTLINTEISGNGPRAPGYLHVSLKTNNCFVTISNCRLLRNRGIFAAQITSQPKEATISDTTIDSNEGGGLNHPAPDVRTDAIALNNCRITNNRAGGIRHGGGRMHLNECLVKGNTAINQPGGGITSSGDLTIDESTIADNTCASDKYEDGGGGIATSALYEGGAKLTINNSTVSGNKVITTGNGGGIWAANSPFVNHLPLAVTLNNSTVSGNSTNNGKGGGIYFNSETGRSALTLISSTFTRNQALGSRANGIGGGVFSELRPTAIVSIDNTIVAGNTDAKRYSPDFWGYVSKDRGYNLIGESDGSDGWSMSTLIGTIDDPIHPFLGNLADNGGTTQTHALLTGSPAIGNGDQQFIGQRDQRGVTRNNPNDIGAYYSGGRSSPGNNSNAGGK